LVGLDCHHTIKWPPLPFSFDALPSLQSFFALKREVRSMKNEKQKIRLIKEDEKIRQVTHWDLDYLPKDEILDLYQRERGHHKQKNRIGHATDESNKKLSLVLIATGLLMLAGTLFVMSLI
jgi:hypothetical protein